MADSAIWVEGLVKRFKSVVALKGIDFEVQKGTIFGLLGPNGAGKTTTIRILATVLRADEGQARVMGHDVFEEPFAVRCQIGLAGQNAAVDPNLTGRENLRMIGKLAQVASSEIRRRADELLDTFDLMDAADRPLRTYSGGMRRRLDVAAALVSRPPIIFLDEPTTGLDVQSRTELWGVIRNLVADGSTVLLTTQYLEEADQLADRIAVMDLGRIVANDTAALLKSRLGNTVIEMEMENEAQSAWAEDVLQKTVADGQIEHEGVLVRINTDKGPLILIQAIRSLDAWGLVPIGLSVREPSLDDVFLTLTGTQAISSAPTTALGGGYS
ncbi:MAG: daunorubicin/doxorubicin resistance ABC transporter ATP-binding protein DrrA [Candidatus Solincola sediminis]|uniref:Daunorubicin/doxorubicin resistance ABC transporter ATP-binding protein DrrA n=1 Tax=Candidatus Solincola sediminis TaxID=1797199 RepID=A0A1F2WUD9_9ACTN|nr:MAG: daunorubicin/doxorubicin resistance ABC transporter ATP-binding protein DrrA [Candidatus Solincola sediminis]